MRRKNGLLSLPGELVLLLLETYLSEYSDLLKLCRLNKFFHSVATQLLYRTFRRSSFEKVQKFLLTVINNRSLASYVRSVDIPYQFRGSARYMESYLEAIQRIDCRNARKIEWEKQLLDGHYEAYLDLLLAHLPQLQHLAINSPFDLTLYKYHECNLELFTCRRIFSDLQTVSLQGLPYDVETLKVLFKIPTLRKFHLSGTAERYPNKMILEPHNSDVEEIIFESLHMSYHGLKNIVLACKRLKSFALHTPVDDRITTKIPELLKVLETFRDSLEKLQLRWREGTTRDASAMCSLSRFRRLRIVDCDALVLLNAPPAPLSTFLPESIESLHIHAICNDFFTRYNGDHSIRADLIKWGGGVRRFPQLQEVRLIHSIAALQEDRKRAYHCVDQDIKFSLGLCGA